MSAFLLLTSYVVNAVWQVAALGAAAWGLSRFIKPAGPGLQHKIWVAAVILATVVPATPVIQSFFTNQSPNVARGASSSQIVAVPQPIAEIIFQPRALYLASALYIAALLLCFLRLCWVLLRTAALVRNAHPVSLEPDHAELWQKSKERFSVQSAALLLSQDVTGPVAAGLWRPVLLFPATFLENHSQTEFQAAVAHECAHIRRNDFAKNVFYEIIGLFSAVHPVTWFIKSQIAQTREMVCDGMAAEQLQDRRTYALSLLQLASKMQPASSVVSHAIGMFDSKILERRIMVLTTSTRPLSRIQRCFWSLTAVLLLSICAGAIGSMTQTVTAQTQDQTSAVKKASKDLSCTYYAKSVGHPGTCGFDKEDKTQFRCYSNENPAESNPQVACEWKVRRAQQSQK